VKLSSSVPSDCGSDRLRDPTAIGPRRSTDPNGKQEEPSSDDTARKSLAIHTCSSGNDRGASFIPNTSHVEAAPLGRSSDRARS